MALLARQYEVQVCIQVQYEADFSHSRDEQSESGPPCYFVSLTLLNAGLRSVNMDDRMRELVDSHQSSKPYKYEVLGKESFRPLQILPGSKNDHLELRFEIRSLSFWHPKI